MSLPLVVAILVLLAFPALGQARETPAAQADSPGDMGGIKMDQSGDMHGMPSMSHDAHPAEPRSSQDQNKANMPDMNMQGMKNDMPSSGILGDYQMSRDASGTSWQPDLAEDLAEHHGIHAIAGGWTLMGHLTLWGIYDTQSGRRGNDKFFLAGMIMGAARRDFSDGDTLNFRAMLSPDPFMGKGGYPLLLATGETANGVTPLIDRQHPHDLFMELSGTYSHKLNNQHSVFFYAADPGEPALGPPAFMHRPSGMDIPQAPITHHWLDSTHIVFGVLAAGFVHDTWKLEVSQFTGREPDQERFDFDPIRLDSTSVRLSWNPDEHWSLQGSWGYLKSPEQLSPQIDENRYTASAMYVTKLGEQSSFAATLAWGLKDLSDDTQLNAVLLEGEYKPSNPWTAFARAEWEQNNELSLDGTIKKVSELSVGGIHDWTIADHWKFGLGALYTFDFVPSSLSNAYGGSDPHGAMIFARVMAQ